MGTDATFLKDLTAGFALLNQNVQVFEYGNVLVDKHNLENRNVKIVSGGDCFYGPFVGAGMLTCSIQGEESLSPTPKVILRTIREITVKHSRGVLIIVPNTSSNMLSFGLAIERAINDKIVVKFIEVHDNFPNSNALKYDDRTPAGAVFIFKIAGAMAENGDNLEDIYDFCNEIINNIVTVKLDFNQTKMKCSDCRDGLREPKVVRSSLPSSHEITTESTFSLQLNQILNIISYTNGKIEGKINLQPDDNIIVFINNTDYLNKLEEYVFAKEFVVLLTTHFINVHRFYIGNFVNPSNQVTVTIMTNVTAKLLEYLDKPCAAPGWQNVIQTSLNDVEYSMESRLTSKERLSQPVRGPQVTSKTANIILFSIQFACEAVISCEKQLNLIDSERSKGNAGTRLKLVANTILKRLQINKLIVNYPFTLFLSLSKLLESTVGDTSGCIYSIILEAAANYFDNIPENKEIDAWDWLGAFKQSAESLKKYGKVEEKEGTIYDPLVTFVETTENELTNGGEVLNSFNKGVEMAEQAAAMTKKNKKFPDSGAHSLGIVMRAVLETVKLRLPGEC